jgi:phosphate:Na+ symporter
VIDRLQHEITEYLVALSRTNLTPQESELIPALIHAVNDAERLGDHAEAILELYDRLQGVGYAISAQGLKDLNRFKEEINEQFNVIYGIFERKEPAESKKAFQVQRNLSKMMVDFTASHVDRLEKGICHVQAGVVFLDALNHLDRVGDHLTNIAERAGVMVAVTAA